MFGTSSEVWVRHGKMLMLIYRIKTISKLLCCFFPPPLVWAHDLFAEIFKGSHCRTMAGLAFGVKSESVAGVSHNSVLIQI